MKPKFTFYHYDPNFPVAIVVAVIYTLAFIATVVQFLRYKSWVWTTMVVAAAMESAGYIARCLSVRDVLNKNLYTVQYTLIILAPVLMAAGCYVVFGRIVFHVVPRASRTTRLLWIPPRFITPIFVASDILALVLQLWGAVQIVTTSNTDPDAVKKVNRGRTIAEIGVAIQLACFGLFALIAVRFNFTSKRFAKSFEDRVRVNGEGVHMAQKGGEKYVRIDGEEKRLKKNWQAILRVTNIASLLILVRSVYRMVDFSLGKTGYTETHEWVLYVFDSLVILPVVVLYIPWHPGKYLPYLGFRLPKHAR